VFLSWAYNACRGGVSFDLALPAFRFGIRSRSRAGSGFRVGTKPAKKAPAKKVKRKLNPALMKPIQPDAVLGVIVGTKPLPRSAMTKKLWDYIKKNNLQDPKKRTMINADPALKAVFGGKKQVSMFEMTKLVSAHVK